MPYRPMFATIITVALALVAVVMWIRTVEPMMRSAGGAATAPFAEWESTPPPTSMHAPSTADHSLRTLVQRVLFLSFILICMLLVVGFFASFREWVVYRIRAVERRKRRRTEYVDAWKLAGERMAPEKQDDEETGGT